MYEAFDELEALEEAQIVCQESGQVTVVSAYPEQY